MALRPLTRRARPVAAAQYRRGHDCLDFLRHHADIRLVAAVVAEAVEVEAVIEVAEKRDVVLTHHVGSPRTQPNVAQVCLMTWK